MTDDRVEFPQRGEVPRGCFEIHVAFAIGKSRLVYKMDGSGPWDNKNLLDPVRRASSIFALVRLGLKFYGDEPITLTFDDGVTHEFHSAEELLPMIVGIEIVDFRRREDNAT